MTTDEILADLYRYGMPRLGVYGNASGNGWHCCVDLWIAGDGISFEVKSDFRMGTAHEAAVQCWARLQAALASLDDKKAQANKASETPKDRTLGMRP